MGAKVSSFIVSTGRAIAKGAVSYMGSKIPFVGGALANKINEQFAHGGKVTCMADGGIAGPKVAINTVAQLINLMKKAPEQAKAAGLSIEMVKDAVAKSKSGEAVVAKRNGGMMKGLKAEKKVLVHAGGKGHGVPTMAMGGRMCPSQAKAMPMADGGRVKSVF